MEENRLSIAEIREILGGLPEAELEAGIARFRSDDRQGVQKLVEAAGRRAGKYRQELERIDGMRLYEKKYAEFQRICGIDEVGRGPLAGPVAAAAVILPEGCVIPYVNDSKKLTEKKREELYEIILEKAVSVGYAEVGPERIDEINILQATYEAMRTAVAQLSPQPDLLLVDAVRIPDLAIRQVPIIKGDAKSLSIACASIIAKVRRDRYMRKLAEQYPEYDFAGNKGYGSASHMEALRKYGLTPVHRKSFIHLD